MNNSSPVYKLIAQRLQAYLNCIDRIAIDAKQSGPHEWRNKHASAVNELTENFMPSGSGIDCGTKFNWEESNPQRLVFNFSFHHMNEGGMYDGWTEHKLVVKADLTSNFDLKITGRNRNQIKEYLYEVYDSALTEQISWTKDGYSWAERWDHIKLGIDGEGI